MPCCKALASVLCLRAEPSVVAHYQKPPSAPFLWAAGKLEKKEHILNERDALFVDLRHKHFAAASNVGWGTIWPDKLWHV